MSGNLPNYQPASGDNRSGKPSRRIGSEPLKRFTEAKKAIGDIYNDLEGYVNDLSIFYHEVINGQNIVPDEQVREVERFMDSIKTIKEIFHRDNMKVVFFGRTSNGKSSVINAMLHSKVLPQGMGHTTCCFLQVEGGSENEKYLVCEDSPRHHDISELEKLGHAMSANNAAMQSMGQDSLVRVFYPKSASRLLQNDVVILDSPGVDLSPEFDSWIDKHCLDADVFVLVCNAEATLTQAEKSFFHRVSSKLSKPNIFILNNRWDASAAEGEHMQQVEKVRDQHMTRFKQFLVDELRVCNETDAKNRIFFISAREMLDARLKQKGLISKAYQMDGHQYRAMEFANFESQFEQIISKSAISTKFEAHERRAREIVAAMRANLEIVQSAAGKKREALEEEFLSREETFKQCLHNWKQFERSVINESQRLRAEVHLKVAADFHEEIYRLEAIIDKFDYKFVDEPKFISEYKRALAEFVDKTLSEDLEARCTGGLMQRIWNLENDMYQHVHRILTDPYTRKLEEVSWGNLNIWRYRPPFRFSICVNCPSLVEDFQEDLEFRFSFGLTALVRRFIAYRSGQPVTAIGTRHFVSALTNPPLGGEGTSEGGKQQEGQSQAELQALATGTATVEENAVIAQVVLTSASYIANGGLGLIVIGGLVYRTLGWRVIAAGALAYGGLYALERWRWNSGAKEQHLKDQFRSHLATRMRSVAAAHTAHCESQVVREMEQVYGGLKATVGGVHQEMKSELDAAHQKIGKIEGIIKGLNTIKGKTAFLNTDLDRFESEFLKADSPVLQ
uniref:Transmembrane GTPase fzo-1 n=1 Tax=Ascaris suum TaxID=6253 RepID=F1KVN3_ASCSU